MLLGKWTIRDDGIEVLVVNNLTGWWQWLNPIRVRLARWWVNYLIWREEFDQ